MGRHKQPYLIPILTSNSSKLRRRSIIMNSAMRSRLVPVARRLFSTGQVAREGHPKYQKVKELQQKFQADVGTYVPIHLRGGQTDMVLIGVTMTLVAFVAVKTVKLWYTLAMKGR